jgi:hypothetical protein
MRDSKSGFVKRHLPGPGAVLVVCAVLVAAYVELSLAGGSSSQTAFPSPDDASRALVSALREHKERAAAEILGGGSELISSDDKLEDTLERERFLQKYLQMHRWVGGPGGIKILHIGAENWPFPIPIVSRGGMWRFDAKAGSDEVRFRRIGENEVTAIGMCDTLVTAETHPGSDTEADHLLKTLLPQLESASKPLPFHGYYFRILSNSAGVFVAVAYPVEYRSSGVMTFVVTRDGGVSEKDLGPSTAKIAESMTSYHSDATWTPAESKP